MSLSARISAGGLILALAGCAVVNVQTAGKDDVEITRGLGIVSVQVKPGAGAVVVESVSLGLINSADGFSLGYRAASTAAVARDSCRLIVWVSTYGQLKELNELLQDRTDVCVVRTHYSKKGETR
jgi:hypothetical protein